MIRNLRFATRAFVARPHVPSLIPRVRMYSNEAAASSELVSALRSEHDAEIKAAAETEAQDKGYFGSFLKDNGFSVVSNPGSQDVSLVRQVGDETVRIFFDITDAANAEPLDEEALEEGAEEVDDLESPIYLNIVVERPKGALSIEAIAQDSAVLVQNIIPYASAKIATEETSEADFHRRSVYQGPLFAVLDPSVQGAVENFLESRNINGELADFITEFATYKENQEYIEWLNKIADIVE